MRCVSCTRAKIEFGLRVCDVDRAGDAIDVTAHDPCVSHHLDLRRIADPDRGKARLLEIPVDKNELASTIEMVFTPTST